VVLPDQELTDMRRPDQPEGMTDEDRSMNHTDAIDLIRQVQTFFFLLATALD
jgi:hypothetical protein